MLRLSERTRKVRVLLIVLLLASIALVTIDVRSHGNGPLSKIGNAVASVLGPLQDGIAQLTRPIGNFFAGFTEVGSLKSQIRHLKEQMALMQQDQGRIATILADNIGLRRTLGLKQQIGFKTETAEVIGRGPSNFEQALIIDAGTSRGVRRGMAVISADGLVGRITDASSQTSTVLLVVDSRSSVAARLATNHEVGTVDGKGSKELEFRLLDPNAPVLADEEVVTTGESGIFPSRITIGKITRVDAAGGNPTRLAYVKPAVDFTSLEFVLVVTDPQAAQRPDVIPSPSPSPGANPSPSVSVSASSPTPAPSHSPGRARRPRRRSPSPSPSPAPVGSP